MRVTALMENTAPVGLACEHGLALYIEHRDRRILLDAGASPALVGNADKLGVDLSAVDAAVLSHGHFDHSGGFCAFFDRNLTAPLYLRPQAVGENCMKLGPVGKYIGVPRDLPEHTDRMRFVEEAMELFPGVHLLPHTTPGLSERGRAAHMCRKTAEGLVPDDFAHEQTLVLKDEGGLVLFSSCSHAGADTVVEEAMAAFPGQRVLAFFGGFHLMGPAGVSTLGLRPEQVEALGRRLLELDVGELWTGHCTGTPAFELLRPILGERLHYLSTGTVVER